MVIPLYNKGSHIADTLDRVLAQSFADFEVIVVDDGSTDGGVEIARAFASARVRVIEQANAGVSSARNRGIDGARGDYIALLDADDMWTPDHLEKLDALIESYPGRAIYSCAHALIRNGTHHYKKQPDTEPFIADGPEFLEEYAKSFALVHSSTVCIPRLLFAKIGGFPVGITKGEDVYVWIRAALAGGIAYSSALCTYLNQDAENRSVLNRNGEIPYYIRWLGKELGAGKLGPEESKHARRLLRRSILFNAAACRAQGDPTSLAAYRSLSCARSPDISFPLAAISVFPEAILRLLRRYRHKAAPVRLSEDI
ncbi:glycosyltransferase family 2 protein [Sphingopyxis sp. 113P3]|uniref:glycosyltransferase family 2 protein n=1 Tax=Sphingopyxis sp. (strain 113P3) TaxID=292913 RepID=UPI00130ED3E6|nr:glycosyltransferase family 2 protein [Sphingopyxis sp. 113P3]